MKKVFLLCLIITTFVLGGCTLLKEKINQDKAQPQKSENQPVYLEEQILYARQNKTLCENNGAAFKSGHYECLYQTGILSNELGIDVVPYSCDCGNNKCWDGKACVNIKDYQSKTIPGEVFEVFKTYFSQKFNWEKELITITVRLESNGYLQGNVTYQKDWIKVNGIFYAVKIGENWQVVADSSTPPLCDVLYSQGFSKDMDWSCGTAVKIQ